METKLCVICGREVQREESVAAYMEFSDVDSYVSYVANYDMDYDALWWMHTLVPPRNEYADIYPLHIDCTSASYTAHLNAPLSDTVNAHLSDTHFSIGDIVHLAWQDGFTNDGTVVIVDADAISISFPSIMNDVLDYELGVDGSWYEINESNDPICITKNGAN